MKPDIEQIRKDLKENKLPSEIAKKTVKVETEDETEAEILARKFNPGNWKEAKQIFLKAKLNRKRGELLKIIKEEKQKLRKESR